MSLLTVFGITSVQNANKKKKKRKEKKSFNGNKTRHVDKRSPLNVFVLFIMISLSYSAFWYLGQFSAVPRFRTPSSLLPLQASPVYRTSQIVLSIKSTLLNFKCNILAVLTSDSSFLCNRPVWDAFVKNSSFTVFFKPLSFSFY